MGLEMNSNLSVSSTVNESNYLGENRDSYNLELLKDQKVTLNN